MKWEFELEDQPKNIEYPIVARQIYNNGATMGPYYLKIEDLISAFLVKPDERVDNSRKNQHSTSVLPLGTIRYSVNDRLNPKL